MLSTCYINDHIGQGSVQRRDEFRSCETGRLILKVLASAKSITS